VSRAARRLRLSPKNGLEVEKRNTSIYRAPYLREAALFVKRPAASGPVVRVKADCVNGPRTSGGFRALDELTPDT